MHGFKFQAAWITHSGFNEKIKEVWNDSESAFDNVRRIAPTLQDWNKNCFGNIHSRKKRLIGRFEGIQRALSRNHNHGLMKLDRKLRKDLDEVLVQEELLWF